MVSPNPLALKEIVNNSVGDLNSAKLLKVGVEIKGRKRVSETCVLFAKLLMNKCKRNYCTFIKVYVSFRPSAFKASQYLYS